MDVRRLRGGHNILHGRFRSPDPNVVGDGVDEQERLLKHDRAPVHQVRVPQVAQVDPVKQDRAFRRIVEAQQERKQRGLAGPSRPHNTDGFTGVNHRGDAAEGEPPTIRERHVSELDHCRPSEEPARSGTVLNLWYSLQDQIETIEVWDHLADGSVQPQQSDNRRVNSHYREEQAQERLPRHTPGRDVSAADDQDEDEP